MFDLEKLTGLVSGLFGGTSAEAGLDGLIEQIGALGIDPANLEGLDAQQIIDTLADQGIDLTGLDPQELASLGSETGLETVMPDLIDHITNRAA